MKILAIDTSGQQAGAAILAVSERSGSDNYITIGEILLNARTGENSWTHSEILMPGIDSMFRLTGFDGMDGIDYVAYTSGPGSFTGLRIGASTALGLARGLNKQTIAVPTLDALAYNVLEDSKIIVPMMDARRGQVYFAIFLTPWTFNQSNTYASKPDITSHLIRATDYLALPVGDAIDVLQNDVLKNADENKRVIFLGDGADAYRDEILAKMSTAQFAKPNLSRVRASSVGAWALDNLEKAQPPSGEVEILYVRAPQAVREKA